MTHSTLFFTLLLMQWQPCRATFIGWQSLFAILALMACLAPLRAQPDSTPVALPAVLAQYEQVYVPAEGMVRLRQGDRYGFARADNGVLIAEFQYKRALDFSMGRAVVAGDSLYGFIDSTGAEVIPLIYERAWSFRDSLAMVRQEGSVGFIDLAGNVVIPLRYQQGQSVQEGMAMVSMGGKSGFYDKQGNPAVPLIYDEAWPFFQGKAYVRLGADWFYINKKGDCMEGCK